jgi:CheY-like chemotaxis protein
MDSDPPPFAGAPTRILLVDDDDAVRSTLRKVLERAGYEVEEAATGTEAVAAFDAQCPDVLLSDLVLPAPNGQQLASLCRDSCPDTVLIFMSGYSEEELHRLRIKQVVFMPKPIEAGPLLRTLERLLR